jgi:hypothetical protein
MGMENLIFQTPLQDGQAGARCMVLTHTDASVIAMPVRDNSTCHWAPRVDVEIAGGAI